MELPLRDRLEKTRASLRTRLDQQAEALDQRRKELRRRGEALRHRAEERVEAGRGKLAVAEAQVLEAAADALAKANDALGGKADFVERGERALRDALIELRAGHEATLPLPHYDTLNVKQIAAALEGLQAPALRTLRAYEARHKARVTVLRDLDKRLAAADVS